MSACFVSAKIVNNLILYPMVNEPYGIKRQLQLSTVCYSPTFMIVPPSFLVNELNS